MIEVPKAEVKGRKIANRMDEFITMFMQDNHWREIEGLPVYPPPKTNLVRQNIQTANQVARITIAAIKEAESIMQVAFSTACNNTASATTLTDCTGREQEQRATSPAFSMPREDGERSTMTDGTANPFVIPTAATNCQGRQENRHNVTFERDCLSSQICINHRLMNFAHNSAMETTATNHDDCQVPTKQLMKGRYLFYCRNNQGTQDNNTRKPNRRENLADSSHNTSYNNDNYLQNRECNRCGQKGHLQRNCTKASVYCDWCKRDTHDTIACKTRGRYASTPFESPSAGNYHLTQSPCRDMQPSSPVEPHITRPSPTPSGGEDWARLLITRLETNNENSREVENQRRYLDNIEVCDGQDKNKCLAWVSQVQ